MQNPVFVADTNDPCTLESGRPQSTTSNGITNHHQHRNRTIDNEQQSDSRSSNGSKVDTKPIQNHKPERENWGRSIEFLMSCITMSVGLGNVWRFPFTALENGGGAFLFPYLIVLLLIGRPIYYLEMVIGQFSSRNSINAFDMVPFLRGVGIAQIVSICLLSTYYSSIMALVARFLYDSFQKPLPWSECKASWTNCIDPSGNIYNQSDVNQHLISSSEYYFSKEVLNEVANIENGIGTPILNLSLFLLFAWICIAGVLIKGIRSSGKASYFLALFPYVIIGGLLMRAVTLEGAWNGILYFIRPRWDKILEPKVWYAAVTQCFFSLAVGFGNVIMYSSYNKFSHNIYRDVTIVTSLDTFTSLLAGCTIFGILGHLAHELGTDDIGAVVKGGPGLAFISYPDAIARFNWAPQFFSVLFFFMLFVLGIGSNIAMCSCITTIFCDKFPNLKAWQAATGVAIGGYLIGLVFVTPGGQSMLNLVDFFGTSFIIFMLTIVEIIAVCWIYGVNRLCRDIEFMLNIKPGLYWRLCWGIFTPVLMISILFYTFTTFEPITYKGYFYPNWAYALGWTITAVGIVQLPIWATYTVLKQKGSTRIERIKSAFRPTPNWGPQNVAHFERYQKYLNAFESEQRLLPPGNWLVRFKRHVFG